MSELLQGGRVIGDLHFFQGPGDVKIDLGTRPADANAMVVLVTCEGLGTFDARFGGESHLHKDCAPADSWGLNSNKTPTNSSVSISQDTPFAYYVTAQWAYIPPAAQPSAAQQAEIADGVVTPQERADAIARFIACSQGAGYSVTTTDGSQGLSWVPTPPDSAAGVATMRCSEAELSQVEALWQAQKH
ncbi:MAG TPA: hypothetical protein VN108_06085 [Marmoricola sp.]|nr:hypothetical protein [Marmoricola sp.]